MEKMIKCTRTDPIAFVLLNLPLITPETENQFLDDLFRTMEDLDRNPDIHAIILTGSGQQSAPHAAPEHPAKGRSIRAFLCRRCVNRIIAMRAVTIAAINGSVYSVINKIVMACDMRFGTGQTSFQSAETPSAQVISARQALHMGLLDEIVDSRELIGYCMEQAEAAAGIVRSGYASSDPPSSDDFSVASIL